MNSGIDHEHSAAIDVAAEWLSQNPRDRIGRPIIPLLREKFGLSAIEAWRLPTRPTKATDSRAKGFGDISVELDAIEPRLLRGLVEMAIQRHLPPEQFKVLIEAEKSERMLLANLVDRLGGEHQTSEASGQA